MVNEFVIQKDLLVNGNGSFGSRQAGETINNDLEVVNSAGSPTLGIIADNGSSSILNFGDTDSNTVGQIIYDHSSNQMQFKTAGALRFSADATNVSVVADMVVGNDLTVNDDLTVDDDLTVSGLATITETVIVGGGAAFGDIARLHGSIANEIEAVNDSGNASIGIFSGGASVGSYNFGTGVTAASANIEYDHSTTEMRFDIDGTAELSIDASGGTTVTTIAADMVITGDLTVNGTTTTVNSTDLNITDNVILLNKDETGPGVTLGVAGIEIERGPSDDNAGWYFNESENWWGPTGPSGSLELNVGVTQTIGNIAAIDPTTITGEILTINGIGAIKLPSGTTGQQPSGVDGMVRYNDDLNNLEGYINGNWEEFFTSAGDITITGDITMDTGSQIFIDPGTASDPGLAFTNDTDTGIFLAGGDTIGFSTDGLVQFTISDTTIDAQENEITNIADPSTDAGVGDRAYNDIRYTAAATNTETIQDVVGGMVTGNTENGIVVTYNDGAGKLNFDVNDFTITLGGDLTGNVTITNLANGTLTATVVNDSHTHDTRYFTETEADTRFLRRNATSLPSVDESFNLGSSGAKWANIYATTFNGTATKALYSDLAERYAADGPTEPGDVVVFGGEAEITLSYLQEDTAVAGIISTNPAYMMNSEAGEDKTHPYVALKGKVPCKVLGPIKKGDLLVTSQVHGYAMSAGKRAKAYTAFARALENYSGGKGVIEVAVI